jgi:hypothetical protein
VIRVTHARIAITASIVLNRVERAVFANIDRQTCNNRVENWEIVADKISAAGWSWGYCSAVTRDGWRWIVDADLANARRPCVWNHDAIPNKTP